MERYLDLLETANEFLAKAMFRRMKPPFEFRIKLEDTKVGRLFYLEYCGERFGGRGNPFELLEEHAERLILKSHGIDYPKEAH
jgi:hypothetical protein